jgi:hypothetical protein
VHPSGARTVRFAIRPPARWEAAGGR